MIDRSGPPGSADVPVGSHFGLGPTWTSALPGNAGHAKSWLRSGGGVIEDIWCGGSGLGAGSLMPLEGIRRGQRSAARLRVLLSVAWWPRTRSEVRCGWGLAMWLRTFGLLMGEWDL